MLRTLALVLALAVGAGGCDADVEPRPGLTPLDGPLPAAVANRTPLPICGSERPGLTGPWNEAARRCFVEAAAAGRPVEFVTRFNTIEGDPIQLVYRVLGPGSIEVFVDSTRDKWGSGAWEAYRCPHLAWGTAEKGGPTPDFGMDDSCLAFPLK